MIKLKSLLIENSLNDIFALIPQFVASAQRVYNEWNQDENGYDEELGEGGICQDIADSFVDVLSNSGIDAIAVDNNGMGDQHVWAVAKLSDGLYEIDIPPHLYERGGGYTWKKIPNVKFTDDFIHISKLPPNVNWEELNNGF